MYIWIMRLSDIFVHAVGHFGQIEDVHTVRAEPTDWLLVWVTRGGIAGTLDGKTFQAFAGEAVLMPPGVAQHYSSPRGQPWEWLWCHFAGPSASTWADRLKAHPIMRPGLDPSLRGRWVDLVATHRDPADLAAVRWVAILADLSMMTSDASGTFGAVRRYVQENLADPLTAQQLASVAAMSVPHFNRMFRRSVGVSPMRYVAQQRIARAERLLRDTPAKIATIAQAVGYGDGFHFSKIYKRHTGLSPSDVRS